MRKGIWLFLGGLLGLILTACLARPEITPLPPSPMLPVIPTLGVTRIPPTPTLSPAADDSTCVTCHISEEMLKALAVEPEEAESLSEGEG